MADRTRTRTSSQSQAGSSTTSYGMTAGAGEGSGVMGGSGMIGAGDGLPVSMMAVPMVPAPVLPPPHNIHHRQRRTSRFNDGNDTMSGYESGPAQSTFMSASTSRRRKTSSHGSGFSSAYDEDTEETRSTRSLPDKKQNHSEIEKRRRDKMNTYIAELASMVPMCSAMSRKLDKLTVLRLAVTHLRDVRGALSSGPLYACPRPGYVSEIELNKLLLAGGRDSFLLVVGCDRGRLLFLSASITALLHYDKSELLGHSLFDILHPKDVAKVKEQLSAADVQPRERLVDAKTMLPVKTESGCGVTQLCSGARRSFFCRFKIKSVAESPAALHTDLGPPPLKQTKKQEKKYLVVQCTGYLKSWAPADTSGGGCEGGEEEAWNSSCLVTVGRALHDLMPPDLTLDSSPAPTAAPASTPGPAPAPKASEKSPHRPPRRKVQFSSRHATDGRYLYVDQRVTLALGFLPQELFGTSLYEYVAGSQLALVARAHNAALVLRRPLHTTPYAVRRRDNSLALLQTHFKPFRNPWTKEVECLMAMNTVVTDTKCPPFENYHRHAEGAAESVARDTRLQRIIDSHMESHKIGTAIAEDAMRLSPTAVYALDLAPEQDTTFANNVLADSVLVDYAPPYSPQVRNNVPLSAAAVESCGEESEPLPLVAQPPSSAPTAATAAAAAVDGNGEAAMAVIMSLLEADAGLGGPGNFANLIWPLP